MSSYNSNSKYGKRITTKRTKRTKKHLKTRILRALRVLRGEKYVHSVSILRIAAVTTHTLQSNQISLTIHPRRRLILQ
jgi:hypothetical protein